MFVYQSELIRNARMYASLYPVHPMSVSRTTFIIYGISHKKRAKELLPIDKKVSKCLVVCFDKIPVSVASITHVLS